MENAAIISLEDAKQQLTKLMNHLNKNHREHLLSYAIQEWMTVKIQDDESDEGSYTADNTLDDPVATLNSIADKIKKIVPFEAVTPTETANQRAEGGNSDCDPKIPRHLDAFLYTDDDMEVLSKKGQLKRSYCSDCGSNNVAPFIFISHSTSREELYQIFNDMLPTLDGKTVLDIGSRLGAALYGAYVYTDAKRIVGVEINKEFCDLQKKIIREFKMENRVEIVNSRIEDAVDIVKSADVLIVNNVFYLPKPEQVAIWKFLRTNVKKGAYIVSRPTIASALAPLDAGIVLEEWLKPAENSTLSSAQESESTDDPESPVGNSCYVVL